MKPGVTLHTQRESGYHPIPRMDFSCQWPWDSCAGLRALAEKRTRLQLNEPGRASGSLIHFYLSEGKLHTAGANVNLFPLDNMHPQSNSQSSIRAKDGLEDPVKLALKAILPLKSKRLSVLKCTGTSSPSAKYCLRMWGPQEMYLTRSGAEL